MRGWVTVTMSVYAVSAIIPEFSSNGLRCLREVVTTALLKLQKFARVAAAIDYKPSGTFPVDSMQHAAV